MEKFNGMKQQEFLSELIEATGLNGRELLDYLLSRIGMGKKSASIEKDASAFVDYCYSDTDKFTVSLIMQAEFSNYNHCMGDVVALSGTVYACKAKDNKCFEVRIDVGIKGARPAYIEIYHPVGEYFGPTATTKYGTFVNHYIMEDLSAYEY